MSKEATTKEARGDQGLDGRDDSGQVSTRREGGQERKQDDKRSIAEWVTLGISITILVVLSGLIIYQQLANSGEPANVEVTPKLEEVRQVGERYYLPVEVRNSGGEPTEDVRVELTLTVGEEEPEMGEFSVMFLNSASSETGLIVFSADPRQGELTVSSVSFLEP